MKKIRADQLLVQKGLAPTRSKAQNYILAGIVLAGTHRVEKASELFAKETEFTIKQKDFPYVSRGGVKLQTALDHFKLEVKDKICLDVGIATGGFTDCLLQKGAKKIYGVDVGSGQLDWKLRTDPRVILFEKTNFRHFDVSVIPDSIDLVVMDVSFISVIKLIPKVVEILNRRGESCIRPFTRAITRPPWGGIAPTVIILIKPQFEVGKEKVGKGGIVKNEQDQEECVRRISEFCIDHGFAVKGIIPSPLLGQDGNQEFLLAADFLSQ